MIAWWDPYQSEGWDLLLKSSLFKYNVIMDRNYDLEDGDFSEYGRGPWSFTGLEKLVLGQKAVGSWWEVKGKGKDRELMGMARHIYQLS